MSDSISKGPFFSPGGLEFQTWLEGELEDRKNSRKTLRHFIETTEKVARQQLKLEKDLARQRKDLEQSLNLLDAALKDSRTEHDLQEARRRELEKQMKERQDKWIKPDIRNAPGAIVGMVLSVIPGVGTILALKTASELARDGLDQGRDAEELRGVNDDLESHEGFQKATKDQMDHETDLIRRLKIKQTASLNAVKAAQEVKDFAEQKLDEA